MEIYRVTKDSPQWLFKAYDYIRIDSFCFGQNIPIENEFSHDDSGEEIRYIVMTESHKPVAACKIIRVNDSTARIGRVCVVRDRQKSGIGRILISEAEKWISEGKVSHIVITSQDRAAGFYKKCGYTDSDKDPSEYEPGRKKMSEEEKRIKKAENGFICVVVEKYLS